MRTCAAIPHCPKPPARAKIRRNYSCIQHRPNIFSGWARQLVIRHSLIKTALLIGALAACALSLPVTSIADDADKLQVPPGFVVTHYADDHLAHDIFSMTIDSLGRVVVSGPGYVRILIDANNDGVAETYKQFADGPATGAQGLFFLGRDLLCTGDAGLIRYRDKDQNDRADGPPDVFLRLKTGSEHNAHSIQKGPDGWWYLVVGNDGRIGRSYANLPSSPLKQPQAGTIMRLKPDLSGGEVIADGMRNVYDFAFNGSGDLFVFDSDSEREVSLPWYRPIRVLHTPPGTHAGWVSQSWIRPDSYLDMPKVVASFGRGSPTGVVCYRHTQFPSDYKGALFVLDWTFGRVLAVPLEKDGSSWSSTPHSFMTGKGQFGFAPTDVEIGPDGSLFVSIGGRGTQGSVYRVTYKGDSAADLDSPKENRRRTRKSRRIPSRCVWPLRSRRAAGRERNGFPRPRNSGAKRCWPPPAMRSAPRTNGCERSRFSPSSLTASTPPRWVN
jgi:putative membrane-bound dehydrogenase-like protein